MTPVDKILGADVELGNVIERPAGGTSVQRLRGPASAGGNRRRAGERFELERIWVRQFRRRRFGRCPAGRWRLRRECRGADAQWDPQDWGRKFLPTNGGCAYIDLGHLEICIPEVRSARDFVRYHHAGLTLARNAREAAETRLFEGERLVVMANNSDRLGNSWGGHLNVLVTRELWQRVFDRMYPELFVLAAYQVSSILYTGQGKVGAENGQPWVPFQITQRGDFFECIEGMQTTWRRPIVNSRDEPHCGPAPLASWRGCTSSFTTRRSRTPAITSKPA